MAARIRFEIRQLVRSARGQWLEVIERPPNERLALVSYEHLTMLHPLDYFEVVKVTTDEECLDFTPHKANQT